MCRKTMQIRHGRAECIVSQYISRYKFNVTTSMTYKNQTMHTKKAMHMKMVHITSFGLGMSILNEKSVKSRL